MPHHDRTIRLRRLLAIAAMVFLAGSAPVVAPSLGATARAGTPPFTAPESWSTMCTVRRPAAAPLVRGTNCRWLSMDGVWRRYLVYVPNDPRFSLDRRWPVVLMFHGNGSSGERMWEISGWREQAEAVGAIVVFPTAWRYERTYDVVTTRWNTWKLPREIKLDVRLDGYPDDAPYPARDLAFVRGMLDDARGALDVDDRRVFASGFSNGGKFVVRVGAAMPARIAAVTCGGFCDAPPAWFSARRNISVLYGLGNRDSLVIAELALTADPDPVEIPLAWTAARPVVWPMLAGHLGAWRLDPDRAEVVESASTTWVKWRTPRDGNTDGNELQFVLFDRLPHVYPRFGSNVLGVSMAAISWAFFRDHPLR